MSNITPFLERNRAFAAADTRHHTPRLPFLPHGGLFIVCCMDCRVDPADFLGVEFGEALVARNTGGRVTPAVIQDIAYASYLVDTKAPEGPYFEVAVVHHTDCGSRLLEDEQLRHSFAQRGGYDEKMLAALSATDPAETVKTDVRRLLDAPQISPRITVRPGAHWPGVPETYALWRAQLRLLAPDRRARIRDGDASSRHLGLRP
jgi:carbonic anhydrase